MADNDYICIYRQFFEEFAKSSKMEDVRPIRVNHCDLSVDELLGEIMQSCVNYFSERKCPGSLVVPLTKIVVEELLKEAKKQPEEVDTPLKFNRKVHDKIAEVCLRYTDNEKLSSLPPPVPETYYSTHSTKHTRRRMEDRLICLPRFNTLHSIQSNSEAGYYGIFDGHSGVTASSYAVSHLHQFLAESEYYPDDPVQAFRQAFEKTELKFNSKDGNSGTTVLAILHQPSEKKLTVAWVGDSLAMVVNEDSYVMLIDPHKPERADEKRRIEAMGGCITKTQSIYRVNGGLAISRAIGDKKLKPYISAEPEIRVLNLSGSEHFVVMGCDGLWDVVEPQQVIETVYFEVKKHEGQIDSVAKRLVDLAKENNSTDNISVIVFFLTDPSEISNRSVDVTGHRPKFLHQDGVIMEANFQTDDKSPFSDPSMNGLYETNGNHFNDHVQNESDEDFGPETDVDAVDDVLSSPKNLNPFAKDCWQKATDENSDKLIEFSRQETNNFGGEIMKFAEGFADTAKQIDENNSSQMNSSEIKSDNFPVDNMNPFETPVTNNMSNISNAFLDDSNKYVAEINLKKEEAGSLTPTNATEQTFDFKNDENLLEKRQEEKEDQDLFSFETKGFADTNERNSFTNPENADFFCKENTTSQVMENPEEPTVESPVQKESASEASSEFHMQETSSCENISSHTNEINSTLNQLNEFSDVTFRTNGDKADNVIAENAPLDAFGNSPELCSVIDTVEAEKAYSEFYPMEQSAVSKEEEASSELLSPSAPALDGELKDETVAESGGEVEDSEDDEWNYIKVESGVHQTVPIDGKASDLVTSNELSEIEKPTMNSPLNPEADEFIPVSAMSHNNEFNLNMTPKKAIPEGLTDIIASSPNWNNMNNVSVPEESAFLNEIKSRPSNIYENVESPQEEDVRERNMEADNSLHFINSGENVEGNELMGHSQNEPHGLDLASDMTSSFIDPSTMGSEIEIPKEKSDILNSHIEDFLEKKELPLNDSPFKVEDLANAEVTSKLPDLLSPVPAQEDVSPDAPFVDTTKPSLLEAAPPVATEQLISELSPSPVCELSESKQAELEEVMTPSKVEDIAAPTQMSPEASEKPPVEEKSTEAVSPKTEETTAAVTAAAAVAATAAVTAAVGATAAKKDVKKPTPKATTGVSKTSASSKPLLNGTKTSAAGKKPTPTTQTSKTTVPAKTPVSATKTTTTTTLKTSSVSKTQPKPSTTLVSSTLSKTQARPRPTPATSTVPKASPSAKAPVTTSPTKTTTAPKVAAKSVSSALASTTLKAKPRLSSAPIEKKSSTTVNGDSKSTTIKRTEVTKKPAGVTTTTTTTTTTTRVSLSARPATAPAKPTTLKTTATTTRTVTAKPRTTVSNNTSLNTLSPSSKPSPLARKSTVGADKQAKEVANRITSKTASAPKANGVVQRTTTTTVTKTRKTMTSTATPTKTKNHDKTENKADKILDEKVEVIQSENGAPLVEDTTDINIINSIASE